MVYAGASKASDLHGLVGSTPTAPTTSNEHGVDSRPYIPRTVSAGKGEQETLDGAAAKDTLPTPRLGSQAKSKPAGFDPPLRCHRKEQSRGVRLGDWPDPLPDQGFGRVARTTVESGQGTLHGAWCNRQHIGFWHRHSGFKSLRPSHCWLLCLAHAFFFLSCSACGGRGVSLLPCRTAGRRRRTRRSAPMPSSPDHIPNRDPGQRFPAATLSRSLPRPTCCSR